MDSRSKQWPWYREYSSGQLRRAMNAGVKRFNSNHFSILKVTISKLSRIVAYFYEKANFFLIFSRESKFSRERSSNYWGLLNTTIYLIESLKLEKWEVK